MLRVSIASPQERISLDRERLRGVVRTVLEGEEIDNAEISLAFVDNPTIHQLNKRYLDHDEPTDVLSFPLSGLAAKVLQGELVIGVEVAQEVASDTGHAVEDELILYIIHGVLHLCGYNDQNDQQRRAMRDRERYYLATLGVPDIAERD